MSHYEDERANWLRNNVSDVTETFVGVHSLAGCTNTRSTIPIPLTVKHDEDKLEELFWEFDSERQHRDERLVFKERLREYAAYLAKQ